jgi:hypothetical protein
MNHPQALREARVKAVCVADELRDVPAAPRAGRKAELFPRQRHADTAPACEGDCPAPWHSKADGLARLRAAGRPGWLGGRSPKNTCPAADGPRAQGEAQQQRILRCVCPRGERAARSD